MLIKLLGTGASTGVPVIGCTCDVCQSVDIKNIRTRCSIYIEYQGVNILIDTSPDFRFQALSNKIKNIDFILYTHQHADHLMGIDDIRPFNYKQRKVIPAFSNSDTCNYINNSFSYITDVVDGVWNKPTISLNLLKNYDKFFVPGQPGFTIKNFLLYHGDFKTIGFRIDDFMYAVDFKEIPKESEKYFENLELLILDCLSYNGTNAHLGLDDVLSLIDKFKPKRVVLTHMSHELEYSRLTKILPKGVQPGFDSMEIRL